MGKKYRRDMRNLEKIKLSKDKCEFPEPSPKWIRGWDPGSRDAPQFSASKRSPWHPLIIELTRRGTQVGTQVALLTSLKC